MDRDSFLNLQIGWDVFLLDPPCSAKVVKIRKNSVVISFAGQTKAVYPSEVERLGTYRRKELRKRNGIIRLEDDELKELLKKIYERDDLSGVISKKIRREFKIISSYIEELKKQKD